jgi:type IV pilus assembly protein PilA
MNVLKIKRNTQGGFSLVELMVVVGILAILMLVAVPNYMKFAGKAKKSNARSELTGIYGAEKSYFTEFNTYTGDLVQAAFVPDGIPLTTGCPTALNAGGTNWPQRIYIVGHSAGTGQLGGGTVCTAGTPRKIFESNIAGVAAAALPAGANILNGTAFTIGAGGSLGGTQPVEWTINEAKQLTNTKDGI